MSGSVFQVEYNGLFYEFEFDSDHKWTHHTKWPDGHTSYALLQGAGGTLDNAKKRCKEHIIAWYKDPDGFHVDDKYVDMNNKYIKKMQKRKEDLGTVISTEINLNELKPYTNNSKIHPEHQIKNLIASIKQFGFTQPIVCDEDKTILSGHGRYEAAKQMQIEAVPVRIVENLTDAQKKAYIIADNKIAEQSEWDENKLLEELGNISDLDEINSDIKDLLDFDTFSFYTVRNMSVANLKPHPKNYKAHPADQLEHLKQSITDNGIYRNVIVAKDNTILAGHGVVKAAQALGLTSVPVLKLDLESDSIEAVKLLTADNEVSHLGEVDDRALSNILKEIMENSDLLGTGYDEMMLQNLLYVTRPASEIKTTDHAAEWMGMPDYEISEEAKKLIINFETYEDKKVFCEQNNFLFNEKGTESIWFPEKERRDITSVGFEVVDEEA
tara:strand:- start:349 stop:1668 length:1320 start_codon:yes stop_codon:yes gene_type:complete